MSECLENFVYGYGRQAKLLVCHRPKGHSGGHHLQPTDFDRKQECDVPSRLTNLPLNLKYTMDPDGFPVKKEFVKLEEEKMKKKNEFFQHIRAVAADNKMHPELYDFKTGTLESNDPAPPPAEPHCPQCGKPLEKVRYPSNSMLNRDQWESVRAGDWYCESCPYNGRAKRTVGAYFWDSEVLGEAKPEAPAAHWVVIDCADSIHVMPTHQKKHEITNCWCDPRIENYSVPLVIHREVQ